MKPRTVNLVTLIHALILFFVAFAGPSLAFAGGGSGGFLADTPVLREDGTEVWISQARVGDRVFSFTPDGKIVPANIRKTIRVEVDRYLELWTTQGYVHVTPEHPFYVGNGAFRNADHLHSKDTIFIFDGKGLSPLRVILVARVNKPAVVYNVETDGPQTFFVAGIAVRN